MVVVDKNMRICKIIDFIVPGDRRINEKEKENIETYHDLGRELQKIWNVTVKIIPLVVGSLVLYLSSLVIDLKRLVSQQKQGTFTRHFY